MSYRRYISALAILFFSLGTQNVLAVPQVPEETGFGGFVFLGAGYTEVKSNTMAGNRFVDGGEETISSITDRPQTSEDVHPVFGGELTYTLGNRSQFFFGTSLEDLLTLDGSFQLGWRQQTQKAGIFQVGLLAAAVPTEVWEDPYQTAQTGGARDETDRDSRGARFAWDRIFGTQVEWQVTYRDIKVDKERSGQSLEGNPDPLLDCDQACQSLLQREGDFWGTTLSYAFRQQGRPHVFRPLVSYRTLDADGDSQSYDGWLAQLTYSYLNPKLTFITNFAYADYSYDEANPIAIYNGQKQDSDGYIVDATVIYSLPFESRRWKLSSTVALGSIDSDIDFFNQRLGSVSVSAFYVIGNMPSPAKKK
ncbi:MAG: DUF2860 family protein [Gammaproteobacteria bacterium]